ncbi:MAG: glycosyltransferase family 4 protein [Planctomycetaceae bacterium]|nr:glycosyltransferase family 4 protein [Planctomycetaceae bacterium]
MRIAMIGSRGVPAREGGVERVVEALTAELTAAGHEVLVYSRRHYVGTSAYDGPGRRIITSGLRGKHLDALTHTATAFVDVLRRGVDVVHVHSPGPALWSPLAAMGRLPMVLTVHAPDWRRDKWSLPARWALRGGLWMGMRMARVVTCVSQPLAQELSQKFAREVLYVPNAAPPSPQQPVGSDRVEAMGLTRDAYGLYVGRVVPEKRLDLLIRAWNEAGGQWPLAVAGEVPDDRFGRRCRELAGPGVKFLGPQFGDDLVQLYDNAGFVVHPSALEGMSLVLLEAAAFGKCILAAATAENACFLGDKALYFSLDDYADLSHQISRCISGAGMRQSRGFSAQRLVRDEMSWAAVARRMESLYDRAMFRCK